MRFIMPIDRPDIEGIALRAAIVAAGNNDNIEAVFKQLALELPDLIAYIKQLENPMRKQTISGGINHALGFLDSIGHKDSPAYVQLERALEAVRDE